MGTPDQFAQVKERLASVLDARSGWGYREDVRWLVSEVERFHSEGIYDEWQAAMREIERLQHELEQRSV